MNEIVRGWGSHIRSFSPVLFARKVVSGIYHEQFAMGDGKQPLGEGVGGKSGRYASRRIGGYVGG
jgi:hypothetical protein